MSYFFISNDTSDSAEMRDLGIGYMTLDVAGELIAKCLWFNGQIKAEVPETDDYYSLYDPVLKEALKEKSAYYTGVFAAAINKGTLKAGMVSRTMNEEIIPEGTHVRWLELEEWLNQRNYDLGDAIEEYMDFETVLFEKAVNLIQAERAKKCLPKSQQVKPENFDSEQYWALKKEHMDLEAKYRAISGDAENVKPISEKQRGAYLNIIASLLGLLLGKSSSGKPYSQFSSQQAVIDAIHGTYGEKNGLSKRNLEEKFSLAKRNLEAAKAA